MKSTTPISELIHRTNAALKGSWLRSIGVVFMFGLLLAGVSLLLNESILWGGLQGNYPVAISTGTVALIVFLLCCGPLVVGLNSYFLFVARQKTPRVKDLFRGFDFVGRSNGVFWLTALLVFLWYILGCLILFGGAFGLMFGGAGALGKSVQDGNGLQAFMSLGIVGLLPLLFVIIWFAFFLWIVIRHSMILFVLADRPAGKVIETVKAGIGLVRGNYGKLFGAWGLWILFMLFCGLVQAALTSLLVMMPLMIILVVLFSIFLSIFCYIYPLTFMAVFYNDIKE